MNLLITGADRPLGHLAALHFGDENDLRLTGYSSSLQGDPGREYCTADLRVPEEVEPLLSGVEAVLHLSTFDPAPRSEQEKASILMKGALDQVLNRLSFIPGTQWTPKSPKWKFWDRTGP